MKKIMIVLWMCSVWAMEEKKIEHGRIIYPDNTWSIAKPQQVSGKDSWEDKHKPKQQAKNTNPDTDTVKNTQN